MAMASEWEKIIRGGGCDQETKRPECVGTVEVKASFIYIVRKRVCGEVEGRAPGPIIYWLPQRLAGRMDKRKDRWRKEGEKGDAR